MPADVWAKLTDSTVGNVSFGVQRWDGAKAYKAKTQTWGIAPGNLKGTIYYTRLTGDETRAARSCSRIEPGKNHRVVPRAEARHQLHRVPQRLA